MRATSPSGWAGWDRLGATPSPTAGRILGEDPTVCKTCHRQVHAHRSAPRAPAQAINNRLCGVPPKPLLRHHRSRQHPDLCRWHRQVSWLLWNSGTRCGEHGLYGAFTLTQNPQPAAPNPIGIGGWMAGVSFQRSYVRRSRSS